ncbi:MAG: class I SAM-dependent methyltransferase [Betaproteobacteria bacterium]|nr:class I SAM-dependent methyltransferase [Betaproteobacteria bacterium]
MPKRLTTLPPVLKALLAQFCGWGVVWLVGQLLPGGVWVLAFSQAIAATTVAALLRCARWWLPIHFVFTPLLFAVHMLGISPGVWLAAFVVFALVYWSSYRTQVPLFLTNRETSRAVAELLPPGSVEVLDAGCGIGSFLAAFAQQRRDARLTGIENAPAPFVLARLLTRRHPTITVIRGDFFARSWAEYDLVYAFLSPAPMLDVWEKARREMKPGSLLVSNSFEIPGVEPDRIIEVADRRRTRLFVFGMTGYHPNFGSFAKDFATSSAGYS